MSILDALIQGIIQGLIEFLPVSSDGHLILIQHFTGKSFDDIAFLNILLHIGTLLAVMVVFRKTIGMILIEFFTTLKDIFTGKFTFKAMNEYRRMLFLIFFSLIPLIPFSLLTNYLVSIAGDGDILIEGIMFMLMGLLLYFADRVYPGNKTSADMGLGDSLLVGTCQCFAKLPGISRLGSAISVMILRGYEKEFAITFSFLMGIPVIIGSNIKKAGDALENSANLSLLPVIVGIVAAFLVGLVTIRFFIWIVRSDRLNIFSYYTIFIGVVVIIIALGERLLGATVYDIITGLFPKLLQ